LNSQPIAESSASRQRNPRRLAILAVLATAILILILVVLAEGGVRLRQWFKHGQATTVDAMIVRDPATGLKVPNPGLHSGKIHINSLGFRGPELAEPKPLGSVRLAFLGASTTFCAEVSSDETVWPSLVLRRLHQAYPAVPMDYINAGVPGYVVNHSLVNWERRVSPLDPDVVVIYDVTNDLSRDTRQIAYARGLYDPDAHKPSWLARHFTLWFLVEKNLQIRAAKERAQSSHERIEDIPRALPEGFRQRLTYLVQRIQQRGALVVLPTFSYRPRRDQSPEQQLEAAESALYYMPYMSVEGLLEGYEAYNQAVREVARDTGALLVEGELDIPGDAAHFNDSVHFTDAGSAAMAGRVSAALLASERFRRLLPAGAL
jgi:lysophospholipase L1-like esterase